MADSRHRPRYHCCPAAAAANQRHFRLHCGTRPPDIGAAAAAASDSAIRGCDGDDSAAGVGGAAVVVVDFRSGCAVAVAVAGNSSRRSSGIH